MLQNPRLIIEAPILGLHGSRVLSFGVAGLTPQPLKAPQNPKNPNAPNADAPISDWSLLSGTRWLAHAETGRCLQPGPLASAWG